MGCDIHVYVEIKEDRRDSWINFGEQYRLPRIYALFGKLAGVRSSDSPIVPPRGMPGDEAWGTEYATKRYICVAGCDGCGCGHVSRAKAEKWCKEGSHMVGNNYVSDPDHHTHSWLTLDEWREAVSSFGINEYDAITTLMKFFEDRGYRTRVVFWFDN